MDHFLIVPLFALANAGVALNGGFLARAYTAPITLRRADRLRGRQADRGHVQLVAGDRAEPRQVRPPIGRAAVLGSGTIAGIGFTVALLIARGVPGDLAEAKLGALSAAVAAGLTWGVLRVTQLLPRSGGPGCCSVTPGSSRT